MTLTKIKKNYLITSIMKLKCYKLDCITDHEFRVSLINTQYVYIPVCMLDAGQ